MLFNIYYINFPKVYEIKMILSNIISLTKEKQSDITQNADFDIKSKLGVRFLNLFGAEIEGKTKSSGSDTQKVLETFEIKTTKSVILNEIIERSKSNVKLDACREGELITLENVALSLENEAELRIVKMFTSGSFKGLSVPGANGFDITNLFNSMFKDYAYKMKGVILNEDCELLIKIPITFESEFESSYCVDDLFIGRVTLIGIYKGKIKLDSLRNSFEFYKDLGESSVFTNTTSNFDEEIQDSQYPIEVQNTKFKSSKYNDKEYHFIDLLAIIQNINIPESK